VSGHARRDRRSSGTQVYEGPLQALDELVDVKQPSHVLLTEDEHQAERSKRRIRYPSLTRPAYGPNQRG
jgi:hypothetical protein